MGMPLAMYSGKTDESQEMEVHSERVVGSGTETPDSSLVVVSESRSTCSDGIPDDLVADLSTTVRAIS